MLNLHTILHHQSLVLLSCLFTSAYSHYPAVHPDPHKYFGDFQQLNASPFASPAAPFYHLSPGRQQQQQSTSCHFSVSFFSPVNCCTILTFSFLSLSLYILMTRYKKNNNNKRETHLIISHSCCSEIRIPDGQYSRWSRCCNRSSLR